MSSIPKLFSVTNNPSISNFDQKSIEIIKYMSPGRSVCGEACPAVVTVTVTESVTSPGPASVTEAGLEVSVAKKIIYKRIFSTKILSRQV